MQWSKVHFPLIRVGIKRLVTNDHAQQERVRVRTTTIAPLMDPLEYSRYARQLVAAKTELRVELERAKDAGWTREAMQAFLRERGAGDEATLHSALRLLRQRVLL